jgi:HEPN domain-containing protein
LEAATAEGDDRIAGIVRGDIGGVPVQAKVPIEVEAPTTTSADKEARRVYDDLRARAGLPAAQDGLPATTNPLNPLVTFNIEQTRFFVQAERMYDEGHYDFTVVAAQTACELLVEGAIQFAISRHATEPLAQVIPELLTSYSMLDQRGPKVWEAVTGRSIREPKSVWDGYRAHVERRNALIHKGARVTRDEAAESLSATRDFARQVVEAIRPL